MVPWTITEKIAAAAQRNPEPLLDAVQNEENRPRYRAIRGQVCRGRGANPDISAEIGREVDNELCDDDRLANTQLKAAKEDFSAEPPVRIELFYRSWSGGSTRRYRRSERHTSYALCCSVDSVCSQIVVTG